MAARGAGRYVLVETTLAPKDAKKLAHRILSERRAACANLVPVRSEYWWRGRLENAREVLVSFKTTRKAAPALVRRIRELHPYDVPYVARVPLRVANPAYARWVQESVRPR